MHVTSVTDNLQTCSTVDVEKKQLGEYSSRAPATARTEVTDEELEQHLFPTVDTATYTIEFYSNYTISRDKPFVGIISFWKGANFLEGSSDEGVYVCPRCRRPLNPDYFHTAPKGSYSSFKRGFQKGKSGKTDIWGYCVYCKQTYRWDLFINTYMARLSCEVWAKWLAHYFYLFDRDCDFYFKRDRESLIKNYQAWQYGSSKSAFAPRQDRYVQGQANKELVVYQSKAFIRDSLSGSDPEKQLRVFIAGG